MVVQDKIEIILVTEQNEKLTEEQMKIIEASRIKVLQSFQKEPLANYKAINDEIFSQDIQADLIVLDGGQAVANLMTDANKGQENHIYSKENINEFINDKIKVLDDVTILSTQRLGKETLEEQKDTEEKDNIEATLNSRCRQIQKSQEIYQGEQL